MKKRDFLYWLLNEDGKPLIGNTETKTVETGSDVTLTDITGKPAFLKYAPEGWRDVLVRFGRNPKYLGLFRTFTVPMRFVKDGALILRNLFNLKGIEAYAKLVIHKLDRSDFPEIHRLWYVGDVDFSKFKHTRTDATVNVMEGGVSKILKAYENVIYEIPVDQVNVLMDGIELDGKFNYLIFPAAIRGRHLVPVIFVSGEGTQFNVVPNRETILAQNVSPGYHTTSTQWFLELLSETTITITGTLRLLALQSETYTLFIRTNTGDQRIILSQALVAGVPVTISFNTFFTFPKNERLFLEATFFFTVQNVEYLDSSFTIAFINRFKTTTIKALRPFRLFEKLVEKMSEGTYMVKSDFLTQMDNFVVTSGDAIRGLPGAVIKTSLSEFFQSFSRWSIGLGIEHDKLMIEQLDYFYKTAVSVNVGEVDNLEVVPAEDLIVNSIKAGYKNQTYEDVNGRFEFNGEQQYTTPVKRIIKELDLISPYRADPYGVEFTRINFEGKKTSDSKADNDTFILNIETVEVGGLYKLNRPAYVITGLPRPGSIYNIELSPKRTLLNNGRFIRSVLHQLDSLFVKFRSAGKNSELTTTLGGITIAEKADVLISTLGALLFLPVYFKFTTAVPVNFLELIRDRPYELISFTWQDNQYTGFLFDGGIKPATNDKMEWKLLAGPGNNLNALLNG